MRWWHGDVVLQGVEKNEQAVPELTPKLPEPALKPSVIDTRFRGKNSLEIIYVKMEYRC